jgi:ribonuclease P protein component
LEVRHEKNLSAEHQKKEKKPRLQEKNEHEVRKGYIKKKEAEGQKEVERLNGLMEALKKSRDFRRVIEGGTRENLETIIAYRIPNQLDFSRVGISVSRKSGGSVQRNRVKRRINEAIRRNASFLPEREDIVIVARRKCAAADFSEIENDIRSLGKKE